MSKKLLELFSDSAEQTEHIANAIGSKLRGGEIIELNSDLGGGKTTFTRGLASGAGSTDVVSSPTFTVSKIYAAPLFKIQHFDFYRLPDAGLIAHEIEDLLEDPAFVLVIEWGGSINHVLPGDRVNIAITRTGDDSRRLLVEYPESLSYLVENL